METGMYKTYIKVDYQGYWDKETEANEALSFIKGELEALMPKNICSTSLDFAENITGDDYIDFIGLTNRPLPLSDFETVTDHLVLELGQESIHGLEISIFVNQPDGDLVANYCYEKDAWKELPKYSKKDLSWYLDNGYQLARDVFKNIEDIKER